MGVPTLTLMFRKCSGHLPVMFREMLLFLTLVPEQACSTVPGTFPRPVERRKFGVLHSSSPKPIRARTKFTSPSRTSRLRASSSFPSLPLSFPPSYPSLRVPLRAPPSCLQPTIARQAQLPHRRQGTAHRKEPPRHRRSSRHPQKI